MRAITFGLHEHCDNLTNRFEPCARREIFERLSTIRQEGHFRCREVKLFGKRYRRRTYFLRHLAQRMFRSTCRIQRRSAADRAHPERPAHRLLALLDRVLDKNFRKLDADISSKKADAQLRRRRIVQPDDEEDIDKAEHQQQDRHDRHGANRKVVSAFWPRKPAIASFCLLSSVPSHFLRSNCSTSRRTMAFGSNEGRLVVRLCKTFAFTLTDLVALGGDSLHALAERIGFQQGMAMVRSVAATATATRTVSRNCESTSFAPRTSNILTRQISKAIILRMDMTPMNIQKPQTTITTRPTA